MCIYTDINIYYDFILLRIRMSHMYKLYKYMLCFLTYFSIPVHYTSSLVSLAARFQSARKLLPVTQKSTMTTPRLEPTTSRPPTLPQASPLTARPSAHVNTAADKVGGSSLALDTIFSEEPHGVSCTTATINTTATSTVVHATVTSTATGKKSSVSASKKSDTTKQANKKRKV